LKKSASACAAKKLSFSPAFEWPDFGRSKTGGNESFLLLFFKKAVLASWFSRQDCVSLQNIYAAPQNSGCAAAGYDV
jgi:hypothetical protein